MTENNLRSQKVDLTLESGKKVAITVTESANGEIAIVHSSPSVSSEKTDSETITCTCSSTGQSTTKECPTTNATCDCSDPDNPKITCN